MLALELLWIEIYFLPCDLRQNLDKQINSNVNKEFLPKNSSQKIPPKKFLPKNPPKIFQAISQKNSLDFENIQYPTSHLEAENPFVLVLSTFFHDDEGKLFHNSI